MVGDAKLLGAALLAISFLCACESEADRKIAQAKREVECENRKGSVVSHIVWTLEIEHFGKNNFQGTKNLSDEEFKTVMEKEIIPGYLEDHDDKTNTQIAKLLWKTKSAFENIKSIEVPYASIPGTHKDNSQQEEAIWKIGKEICMNI